ncbi:MCE family protein [Acetobacteraceae bacterium H6797]|nr:MCE family protein [Acetobacteraceae bacterium H6797]
MNAARSLYARVGVLILAAIALGVGFVLFLTSDRDRGTNSFYETYLRESVQGLDVGAAVRYRGVQIGRVTEVGLVAVAYPPPDDTTVPSEFQGVYVRFGIDKRRVGDMPDNIQRVVQQGLRVRLSSQGITGVSYLEMDFSDPRRYPMPNTPWEPRYPVIPSMPSTVAQVQDAAENILRRIEQVPLEELLADIAGLVKDLRHQISPEGDAGRTLGAAALTMNSLREQMEQADIPGLMAELRGTAADARALIDSREMKAMLANGSASMARLPAAIQSLEQAVRAARTTTTDLNADLTPILRDLRATAASLRDVAETMRRSPSQTIFGAPPPAPAQR